jgi:hypothetical protein
VLVVPLVRGAAPAVEAPAPLELADGGAVMLLAIDPGPERTAVVLMDGKCIEAMLLDDNDYVRSWLLKRFMGQCRCVIEMVSCYGMPVGRSIFDTCVWIGRFSEALIEMGCTVEFIERPAVKLHLCNSRRAKDPNVRQAVIDRFPATGGGAVPQIGTKAAPGPLYGVRKDLWAAVALGLTAQEQEGSG